MNAPQKVERSLAEEATRIPDGQQLHQKLKVQHVALLGAIWFGYSCILVPLLGFAAVLLVAATIPSFMMGLVCGAGLLGFVGSYEHNSRMPFIPAKWHVAVSIIWGSAFFLFVYGLFGAPNPSRHGWLLLMQFALTGGAYLGARTGEVYRAKLGTDALDENGKKKFQQTVPATKALFRLAFGFLLFVSAFGVVFGVAGKKATDWLQVGRPLAELSIATQTVIEPWEPQKQDGRFVVSTFIRSHQEYPSNGEPLLNEDRERLLSWQAKFRDHPLVEFVVFDLSTEPDEDYLEKYASDFRFVDAENRKVATPATYVFDLETMTSVACDLRGQEIDDVMRQTEEFLAKSQ